MSIAVESILKAAIREEDEPLNLILINSAERYSTYLSQTNHNFYLTGKRWSHPLALFPENFKELRSIDYGVGYDAVLCLGRYRGLNEARKISKVFHLPLILAELDYPNPNTELDKQSADINIFVNEIQAKAWKFSTDYHLINNCVDSNLFAFQNTVREEKCLTAIQNWRERDWSHGFRLYHKTMTLQDMPIKTLGQTNFVHWQELIEEYQNNLIYFNPTTYAVQPLQIFEAMSCGAIVVAIDNELSREIIRDGVNGFLVKTENVSEKIKEVIGMSPYSMALIKACASESLLVKHELCTFIDSWNKVFKEVTNKTFIGR